MPPGSVREELFPDAPAGQTAKAQSGVAGVWTTEPSRVRGPWSELFTR